MQKLWQLKTDWDSPVNDEIFQEWSVFRTKLTAIQDIKIPRQMCLGKPIRIDIHTFADASETAYGAVDYLSSIDSSNNRQCRLICSKSRIAPLKRISLPKLELCAALLAAQLCDKVKNTLTASITRFTYWSDSTITLHWIHAEPSRFKTFIANRITEIQCLTNPENWRHVPSKLNPADIVSRGATVDDLSTLWWTGPRFLQEEESNWPSQRSEQSNLTPIEAQLELKPVQTLTVTTTTAPSDIKAVISQFGCWHTCIRVLTYCRRFIYNLKRSINDKSHSNQSNDIGKDAAGILNEDDNEKPQPLRNDELEATITTIIRLLQQEEFATEIHTLKSGGTLSKKSKLLPLHPFLDKDGCLRVGGRLKHANISIKQKHPLLLPPDHLITRLILQGTHKRLLHGGAEQTLATVRLRYWPMSGRKLARKITSQCPDCVRFNPNKPNYLMGDLPQDRVHLSLRPFSSVGIDYAGPIMVKESRRRGRTVTTKAYVAVFVCFGTKAVHLELVSSLSTEDFLASLKRFIARRGLPKRIYSDNGKNFVGANNELKEMFHFLQQNKYFIIEQANNLKIDWKFQPPRAPTFGGLWETTVKSMKRHLYKVTHGFAFTFEETYTLLTQIESVLNSRPLSPMSSDPNDLDTLTPAHFLIGDTLLEPPDHDYTQIEKINTSTRYQHLQKIRQHFWKRWHRDYLHTLQVRRKWQLDHSIPVQTNDLVLLKDDNTPPLHWKRGRIIAVHPGQDGITRVVTVKTANGTFKRPLQKICPLQAAEN